MLERIALLITLCSTGAFILLWFWVVRRELRAKENMVDAARHQLIAAKEAHMRSRDGSKEQAEWEILKRSEDVYRQSVAIYHSTLTKPWNYIPGVLMGFGKVEKENKAR